MKTIMNSTLIVTVLVLYTLCSVNAVSTSDPKKILTVGDSWSEYSGNTFADFCDGAIQINKGIGGSTAVGWAKGGVFHGRDVNFAKALEAAGTMNGNDIVVLSVGGNDWMGAKPVPCMGKTLATLQGEVQSAVNALAAAIEATSCGEDCPKIHMFGYAIPTDVKGAQDGCVSTGIATVAPLRLAIANVVAATPEVTYTSIGTMCGGTKTAWSPEFPCFGMQGGNDNIHMNKEGYCLLVTKSTVQASFGCKAKTYDCSKVDRDLSMQARTATTCVSYPCSAATTSPEKPEDEGYGEEEAPAPAPAPTCKNDDAGVLSASQGAIPTCAALAHTEYGCDHAEYGETIKSLCPILCKCAAPACCAMAEGSALVELLGDAKHDSDDLTLLATDVLSQKRRIPLRMRRNNRILKRQAKRKASKAMGVDTIVPESDDQVSML